MNDEQTEEEVAAVCEATKSNADLSDRQRSTILDWILEDDMVVLQQYSRKEIGISEARATLDVDTRELLAMMAACGLPLPRVADDVAERMADEALEAMGLRAPMARAARVILRWRLRLHVFGGCDYTFLVIKEARDESKTVD